MSTATLPPPPASTVTGFFSAASSEADDFTIAAAREAGVSDTDLGIEPAPAQEPGAETPPVEAEELAPAASTDEPPAEEETPAEETPEAKIARLEAELAASKAAPAEPAPVSLPPLTSPLPGQPLATIASEDQFTLLADAAKQLRTWAFANRDGGELPLPLANLMERAEAALAGRNAAPLTEAPFYTPEQTAKLHELGEAMLTDHIPHRRQFMQVEAGALGKVRETAPAMLDAKTPEGETFTAFLKEYPEFRGFPAWPLIVRDLTTGYLANKPKAAGTKAAKAPALTIVPKPPEVQTQAGRSVPLAPAAPIGGSAIGGMPVSQARLDQASNRLDSGTASEEDMLILSAAAV